jgi:hypothetical protein
MKLKYSGLITLLIPVGIVVAGIIVPVILVHHSDPYGDFDGPILYIVFIVTLLGMVAPRIQHRAFIQHVLDNRIVIILTCQILALFTTTIICYGIYRSNPLLYSLPSDVQLRELTLKDREISLDSFKVKQYDDDVKSKISTLKYIEGMMGHGSVSNHELILEDDSLLVVQKGAAFFIYNRSVMNLIEELPLTGGSSDISRQIYCTIENLGYRQSRIQEDLNSIQARRSQGRWSLIQFAGYYYSGQLTPMTLFLVIMNGLKWILLIGISGAITFLIPFSKGK